jgi:hypothetical protein
MKIFVTFLFLFTWFIVRAQEHGMGRGLVLTVYDQQDRIYGAGWRNNEDSICFYPYLIDRPFEDSTSNRYAGKDVIDLYHRDPPKVIRRRIDPSEMIPVTTREIRNHFCFFVDLRNMTQAEQDSSQAFLEYFFEHRLKDEEMQVVYMDKDHVFYHTYLHHRVPVLGNDPAWIPRKTGGEIMHTDVARHIWKTLERRDGEFHHPVFSDWNVRDVIYVYLGRTADFNSPKQEMINMNTVYRTRHVYMHYIDLSEDPADNPFRQTAKLAGGFGMKFSLGKEALTETIMNDLVVHYLWEKREQENTYSAAQGETYPASQKPSVPSMPSMPSKPRQVVLSEPVKKPVPFSRP